MNLLDPGWCRRFGTGWSGRATWTGWAGRCGRSRWARNCTRCRRESNSRQNLWHPRGHSTGRCGWAAHFLCFTAHISGPVAGLQFMAVHQSTGTALLQSPTKHADIVLRAICGVWIVTELLWTVEVHRGRVTGPRVGTEGTWLGRSTAERGASRLCLYIFCGRDWEKRSISSTAFYSFGRRFSMMISFGILIPQREFHVYGQTTAHAAGGLEIYPEKMLPGNLISPVSSDTFGAAVNTKYSTRWISAAAANR